MVFFSFLNTQTDKLHSCEKITDDFFSIEFFLFRLNKKVKSICSRFSFNSTHLKNVAFRRILWNLNRIP